MVGVGTASILSSLPCLSPMLANNGRVAERDVRHVYLHLVHLSRFPVLLVGVRAHQADIFCGLRPAVLVSTPFLPRP